jgi:ABC-type transport system involved in cytochrome bd biosynthesis fused ATPase/permease subunit
VLFVLLLFFSFGHCVVYPFGLFLLVIVLSVLLSFFFWPLFCLSFCLFSFGHCVVCPFVLKKGKQHNGQKKNNKRTNNTMTKRKKTKGQTTQ